MIGGHKVGQGRWSRSGYRSWGQVRGGVKVGGSGRGSRSGGSMSGLWENQKVIAVHLIPANRQHTPLFTNDL